MPGTFVAPSFYTGEELDLVPLNTATTLFALPFSATDKYGTFIVTVYATGANINDYMSTALIHTYNNTAVMSSLKAGAGIVISLSGMNVQVTMPSASGFVFSFVTRLAKGWL